MRRRNDAIGGMMPYSFVLTGGGNRRARFPGARGRTRVAGAGQQVLFIGTREGNGVAAGAGGRIRDRVRSHGGIKPVGCENRSEGGSVTW